MDAELTTGIPSRPLPLPLRLLGDERLARLVGSGHEEAFSILYQRHHQALYRYCQSLVGTETDAQDALQSAMTSALVALRLGRRDAPIRPWLFRIAYNESMTQLRRRRPLSELVEDLPALNGSPESTVEQKGRITRLLADLRELPERQRGALVMRELSGLTHQEVAEALGMSVGAAKQTVFEARRSLQEFDEGRSMACEDIRRLVSDGDGRSLRGRRVRAHLRDCAGCATFAAAIPQRRADLYAMGPALPATAAAGLLWRISGAGSGQAGSGGGAGLISGATSKAVAAGVSSKLVATGALIIVTAAVGTGGFIRVIAPGSAGANHGTAVYRTGDPGSAAASGSGARARASARLARLSTTSGRTQAAGAGHASSEASGRGRSTGHRQSRGGPSTSGQTHGRHQGKGQGVSGSAAGTQGKHLGGQSGSSHGSSPTSQKAPPKPTSSTHPTPPAGGVQSTVPGTGGSGTVVGASGTGNAGASTTGTAQGVTSKATSSGNSTSGTATQKATAALSAG
ncbi:MAG TPA: sigma-70 family RNA polymerase sigma factor [Solirubrobacteraceae bacterium]|nr:sigma-70 family RNA polymerase sigma factor [Solirubrobacteraceae bacterium]